MKLVNRSAPAGSTLGQTLTTPVPASAFLSRAAQAVGRLVADLVAPPVCALCGGAGQQGDGVWGLDLCVHCEAACPAMPPVCGRCALPLDACAACPACTVRPPPYDAVLACFVYDYPVDRMVRGLKFHNELHYARVLGTLLARRRAAVGAPLPDLVLPVPLHRRRFLERGFNQSQEIARYAADRLRLPLRTHLLRRRRETPEQSGLSASARRQNLHGAFELRRPLRAAHVALVDDVLTTGSTAAELARVLKAAGAARVEVWVAARTLNRDT